MILLALVLVVASAPAAVASTCTVSVRNNLDIVTQPVNGTTYPFVESAIDISLPYEAQNVSFGMTCEGEGVPAAADVVFSATDLILSGLWKGATTMNDGGAFTIHVLLDDGKNGFDVDAKGTGVDGKRWVRALRLTVWRSDPVDEGTELVELNVRGGNEDGDPFALRPSFAKDITVYTVLLPFTVRGLSLRARTRSPEAVMCMSGGNFEMPDGEWNAPVAIDCRLTEDDKVDGRYCTGHVHWDLVPFTVHSHTGGNGEARYVIHTRRLPYDVVQASECTNNCTDAKHGTCIVAHDAEDQVGSPVCYCRDRFAEKADCSDGEVDFGRGGGGSDGDPPAEAERRDGALSEWAFALVSLAVLLGVFVCHRMWFSRKRSISIENEYGLVRTVEEDDETLLEDVEMT